MKVDLISLSASAMATPISSRNRISARRNSSSAATSVMFASPANRQAAFFFDGYRSSMSTKQPSAMYIGTLKSLA